MANKVLYIENGKETEISPTQLSGVNINFMAGDNNTVRIEAGSSFSNCVIRINGNSNNVCINSGCHISNVIINFKRLADTRKITIGSKCHIQDSVFDAPYSGNIINIGNQCIIKSKCHFRTEDGHTIFSTETGEVLNEGGRVVIGNHVFVGNNAFFGKNTEVADNTVVLPFSTIVKSFTKPNVMIGGNPAKILRENIEFTI